MKAAYRSAAPRSRKRRRRADPVASVLWSGQARLGRTVACGSIASRARERRQRADLPDSARLRRAGSSGHGGGSCDNDDGHGGCDDDNDGRLGWSGRSERAKREEAGRPASSAGMLVSARGEGGGEEAGERAERVEAGAAPLPSSVVAPRATSPPRREALISAGEHAGLPASSLSARPLLSSPPPSRHVPHSAPLSRAALVSAAKHAEGASCVLCH
uniref:Uncharacterized protein n=1 Tax=Oryza glumipatula TaxID=40148 RepID=A0A0D9YEH2_9ORYZ